MIELIGLILPPVIDLVNKRFSDTRVKFLFSMALCLLVGVAIKFPELQAGDVLEVLKSGSIVFAEAQLVYKTYYQDSNVRKMVLK